MSSKSVRGSASGGGGGAAAPGSGSSTGDRLLFVCKDSFSSSCRNLTTSFIALDGVKRSPDLFTILSGALLETCVRHINAHISIPENILKQLPEEVPKAFLEIRHALALSNTASYVCDTVSATLEAVAQASSARYTDYKLVSENVVWMSPEHLTLHQDALAAITSKFLEQMVNIVVCCRAIEAYKRYQAKGGNVAHIYNTLEPTEPFSYDSIVLSGKRLQGHPLGVITLLHLWPVLRELTRLANVPETSLILFPRDQRSTWVWRCLAFWRVTLIQMWRDGSASKLLEESLPQFVCFGEQTAPVLTAEDCFVDVRSPRTAAAAESTECQLRVVGPNMARNQQQLMSKERGLWNFTNDRFNSPFTEYLQALCAAVGTNSDKKLRAQNGLSTWKAHWEDFARWCDPVDGDVSLRIRTDLDHLVSWDAQPALHQLILDREASKGNLIMPDQITGAQPTCDDVAVTTTAEEATESANVTSEVLAQGEVLIMPRAEEVEKPRVVAVIDVPSASPKHGKSTLSAPTTTDSKKSSEATNPSKPTESDATVPPKPKTNESAKIRDGKSSAVAAAVVTTEPANAVDHTKSDESQLADTASEAKPAKTKAGATKSSAVKSKSDVAPATPAVGAEQKATENKKQKRSVESSTEQRQQKAIVSKVETDVVVDDDRRKESTKRVDKHVTAKKQSNVAPVDDTDHMKVDEPVEDAMAVDVSDDKEEEVAEEEKDHKEEEDVVEQGVEETSEDAEVADAAAAEAVKPPPKPSSGVAKSKPVKNTPPKVSHPVKTTASSSTGSSKSKSTATPPTPTKSSSKPNQSVAAPRPLPPKPKSTASAVATAAVAVTPKTTKPASPKQASDDAKPSVDARAREEAKARLLASKKQQNAGRAVSNREVDDLEDVPAAKRLKPNPKPSPEPPQKASLSSVKVNGSNPTKRK